jgi:hypothetical protein
MECRLMLKFFEKGVLQGMPKHGGRAMWWSGLRSRSRRGEGTLDVVDKVASADLVDGMGKRSPHEATCPRIASGFSEKDAACLPFTQRYSEKFSGLALQVWRFVVLCLALE